MHKETRQVSREMTMSMVIITTNPLPSLPFFGNFRILVQHYTPFRCFRQGVFCPRGGFEWVFSEKIGDIPRNSGMVRSFLPD